MSDLTFVAPAKKNKIAFEEGEVYNFFCSLSCLNQELDGLVGWIPTIKSGLSEQALEDIDVFANAANLMIRPKEGSLKDFFEYLTLTDEKALSEAEHDRWKEKAKMYLNRETIPSYEEFAASKKVYSEFLQELYCVHEYECSQSFIDKNYEKFSNPGKFKEEMISFLRNFWEENYREEWSQSSADVRRSVQAFNSIDFNAKDWKVAFKEIIDRDYIPEVFLPQIEKGAEVVFIPSPHIGPYLLEIFRSEKVVKILIKARIPEGASVRDLDMERAEVYSQLASLADNARLQILRMAAEGDFITTQDVMDRLDLSQSSASRHLNQLAAAGFLSANPKERVKHYKLNNIKIDSAFKLLKDYLKV